MKTHLILLTSALALAACGGDSTGTNNNTGGNNNGGGNQTVTADAVVNVRDDVFDPTATTIQRGQTVGWQWRGSSQHNVIFTTGGIASPTQTTGTFTQPFTVAGTYTYYCNLHGTPTSGMRGTVVVN